MITPNQLNDLRRGDVVFYRCRATIHDHERHDPGFHSQCSGMARVRHVDHEEPGVEVSHVTEDRPTCCNFYDVSELFVSRIDWLRDALEEGK